MNDPCKQCAINCVGQYTLKEYEAQFRACNGDLDLLFSRDTGDDDFYRNVIEPGCIYETGYPKCICPKDDQHKQCECARQALLYLYSQLVPHREITVEAVQTVRGGGDRCQFRITFGNSSGS